MASKKIPDLVVSINLGGSLTKVVAQTPDGKYCPLAISSEIAAILMETDAFNYLDAPMERVTGADVPMPYAADLERAALPQVEDVVAAIERTTYRSLAA